MKILKYGIALLCIAALWGCGKGNNNASPAIDPTTGKHAVGWFDVGTGGIHPRAYFTEPGSCEECHGKDLKGGISKVSCSPGPNNAGCHDIFPHTAGFNLPAAHGKFATGALTPNGIFGMAHCQNCHGLDYTGGVGPGCINCHREQGSNPATNAPHGANWKVSGRHSKSDVSNAAACFKCHAGGAFSHRPQSPAPAGTEPGCFNGTLCHNDAIAHAVPFINATSHGKAIKITSDWPFCGNCHAAPSGGFQRFNVPIGSLTNGCESCHGQPYLAHPQMWLQGRGTGTPTTIGGSVLVKNTSHIDVPAENILTSCTTCHGITAPSANTSIPSCATASGQSINGLRCHFTSPVVGGTGQSNGCKSCHSFSSALDFANVTSNKHGKHVTLLNNTFPDLRACFACHNNPVPGRGAAHADGTPNVAVLAQFGLAATYNNSSKSCSSVSCHGSITPAWTSASAGCLACHATPPDGTIFPNTANAHAKHVFACAVCHNGAGFGTSRHAVGLLSAAVVSLLPSQAGATAAYDPATKTCSNVTCHNGRTITPAWTSSNNGCTACHIIPPTTNKHTVHLNIPSLTCDACHTGEGPGGSAVHPDGIKATFAPQFNDGGAAYTAGACSNVSCHGGKPTPVWTGAAILNYVYDPTGANCTLNCHTVRNPPVQYIDVFNGNNTFNAADLHDFHFTNGLAGCTDCHGLDANKLPQFHFSGLNKGKRPFIVADPMAAGFAAGTIGGTGTDIISYSYDGVTPGVIERGSCFTVFPGTGGCHNGETRFWFFK